MTDRTERAAEHDFYAPSRGASAPVVWPGGAALAVVFLLSVEHYEMRPPEDAFMPPNLPGGFGRGPYPDFRSVSHREYGNRVGVFRLLDLFARFGFSGTAAVDAFSALHRPAIVRRLVAGGWEIAGHGQTVNRVISARMPYEAERAYVADSLAAVERACGRRPRGWHGPEYGESADTPHILSELGVAYLLDWPNDDRPYWMRTRAGALISLPVAADLDDVCAHWHRRIPMERWRDSVIAAADRLAGDGHDDGRVLVLNLHPWLIGQAFRASYLEEVLAALARRTDTWIASANEVVSHWATQQPRGGAPAA
jgi:allantoinase